MSNGILGDRYEIESKIGSGGMADVYLATDKLLARPVAVKILNQAYRSDAEFVEKFQREAKAAARLSHSNIVGIYDVGVDGEEHYIVMEYVPGDTLKEKIKSEGPLDILTAVNIAKDIAAGLSHAHANNIVHCDVKPHNVLMTADGHAKIADFGIARAVTESTMTYGGSVMGSVNYFSPEQARGISITPKSDVYSLGVVLYEMITNRLPFIGENPVSVAMKHIEEDVIPPSQYRPQCPPMLEAVILRAMAKSPESRPSSFDLVQELSNVAATLSVSRMSDPDATQVLPRAEVTAPLPQRRAVNQGLNSPASEKKSDPEKKPFYKSKIFVAGMFFVLLMGFGAGTFMSFGKFWSSEEVVVPDVKGKQLALARQILEDGKLRVNVAETYDADVAPGQVVSQDPEPGRSVKSERLVTIYVSKGGEEIEMPDLKGLAKSAALERIQKIGLKVGSVYEKDSDNEPGTILSHDPASGSKINRGQSVDLVVSRGTTKKEPEKTKVPDVHNASVEVAQAGIEGRGLIVGSITSEISTQAEGTVVSQSPAPDTEVEVGSAVNLVVAKREAAPVETFESEPSGNSAPPESSSESESFESGGESPPVPTREGAQGKRS